MRRRDRAQPRGLEASAEGTLAVATALNPFIGYDRAAEIVKDASASGGTLREVARKHGVDEETLDKALDLRKIAAGSTAADLESTRPRRGAALGGPRRGGRPVHAVRVAGAWPYYARPRLGVDGDAFTAADIEAVRARQRELGRAGDVRVGARDGAGAARARSPAGLEVLEAPLMVLDRSVWRAPEPPSGLTLRVLAADDDALAAARAVPRSASARRHRARA